MAVDRDRIAKSLGLASVHVLQAVSSTQDYARELKDAPPYLVCSASQTRGRGRMGRSWVSAPGGLYFTLVIDRFPADWALPLISAHLIRLSFLDLVPELVLKWPNDIYHSQGKLAGVMVEGWSGNRLGIGVGINVNQDSFPADQDISAASLYTITGRMFDIHLILESTAKQIMEGADLLKLHGFSHFHPAIREALLAGNQTIKFNQSGQLIHARLEDITETGDGVVQTGDGTRHHLSLMHLMGVS